MSFPEAYIQITPGGKLIMVRSPRIRRRSSSEILVEASATFVARVHSVRPELTDEGKQPASSVQS